LLTTVQSAPRVKTTTALPLQAGEATVTVTVTVVLTGRESALARGPGGVAPGEMTAGGIVIAIEIAMIEITIASATVIDPTGVGAIDTILTVEIGIAAEIEMTAVDVMVLYAPPKI
jgi:hypothetical protein